MRGRLAAGRSPEEAAREVIASPEYAEQPFAAWDGPERLIVSADAIARNDGGEVGRPGDVARLGLLAAMGKLAVERASGARTQAARPEAARASARGSSLAGTGRARWKPCP